MAKIRKMEIHLLENKTFKADGGALFSVVPKFMWERKYPTITDNLCPVANRSLLIKTDERIYLFDCGIGSKLDEKAGKFHGISGENTLESSLAQHNLAPEDVTDVILTHLHFDHCGGVTKFNDQKEPIPTYPNARYWVSPEQWANYLNPNVREADSYFPENMMPIYERGMLHFVTPETSFFPELSFFVANGHTTGLLIPIVKYQGKAIAFTGDLIPNTGNIPLKWLASYDIEPLKSLEEKARFLEKAVEENYVLTFQHDYYTECATLQNVDGRIKLNKKLKFRELFE
ncbi:glyoxylase-like metal-dependent hydrolase (beta-lactamase superfamily II) [Balneicella halophila]|uniref:Glyoxylase-like metal-dependent hydrolase (Beta-lactamase superfamily II) n=1 Tax=Balneicella halophila TaxID=1537566 RepID=A0A7L4UR71_BALHA|nr:MBL fold metallo-hydrolase [Balneicella halophila]PVX52012.1 glyoxylase-like metal-dependent hydrolase (beta-lactamase superfamily II) [Balneicella halophila]